MTLVKLQYWKPTIKDLWIYTFILSSIYVLYFLRNYIRAVILACKLKGPPTLPLIGHTYLLGDHNIFKKMNEEKLRSTSLLKIWISAIPFILIKEPEDIQIVLGSMKHSNKCFLYTLFNSFLGNGLIVKKDEAWKQHRRIIHSAFNSNGLEKFCKIFIKHAEYLSLELLNKLDEDINITKVINNVVYNVQSESILGLEKKENYTKEEEEMLPFKKNQQFAVYRLMRPWLLIDPIYEMTKAWKDNSKQIEDHNCIVYKLLKDTEKSMRKYSDNIGQEENDNRTIKWKSLLEYMIQMKEKYPQFTDKDIIEECCTFMLAGMESVSTTTAITLFMLANNKDWQQKCADEVNAILNDKHTTLISAEDLKEMKCLEMCIKETLRLYPSVPLIGRRLSEDEKLGGYVVPAGCNIFISPFLTHRLSQYYTDPESFKPERFDPSNFNEKVHPYAYIPFSIGSRNCIGYKFAMNEIKIMISTILRKFILEPVKGKNVVHLKYRMTLRAQGGLWIRFKARTKAT